MFLARDKNIFHGVGGKPQPRGGGVDKYVYLKVLKYYYIHPNLSQ